MKLINSILLSLFISLTSLSAFAGPVDINTADAATIAKNIKGIGQKRAEAIIAYRKQHGEFKQLEDLLKIKGIGPKTLEANRKNILLTSNSKAAKSTK